MSLAPNQRILLDPAQIRLLASPVRQEVVDTLAALGGEAEVGELAEHLGRSADGLYYHLRALTAGGLLEETERLPRRGRRFRLVGCGNTPLRLAYNLGANGNAEELQGFADGLLQVAGRDFRSALDEGLATVAGPQRELWASRSKGWLSPSDLAEVNALLCRLGDLISQPRTVQRDKLISLAFFLAPVRSHPKRRPSRIARSKSPT